MGMVRLYIMARMLSDSEATPALGVFGTSFQIFAWYGGKKFALYMHAYIHILACGARNLPKFFEIWSYQLEK